MCDTIVNVHSPLAGKITHMLEPIESPRRMLVFQPAGGRRVEVELSRQQLNFFVNKEGLLHSTQLQSEVDINQDIGTWHGLRSKLVCRNATNPDERIVLVPVGKLHAARFGCHVRIDIEPSEGYARFKLNSILGRLDCAAEPTLIYIKALLHAYTSFVVPDQLTSRTGTEEAIDWLQSAICQPWQPLTVGSILKLQQLAALTPARTYYPADLQTMKTDHWNQALPERLQNALFRPLVDRILAVSASLSIFSPYAFELPPFPPVGAASLQRRAIIRQQTSRKDMGNPNLVPQALALVYHSRDVVHACNAQYRSASEVVALLRARPKALATTPDLCKELGGTSCIKGFFGDLQSMSINDKLALNVAQTWGPLVHSVGGSPNGYGLMLFTATLAFQGGANMALIRTLIAFNLFDDLSRLKLPSADEFEHFQPNERPTLEFVCRLLKPFGEAPPSDESTELAAFLSAKDRKKLRLRLERHAKMVDGDIQYFAKVLLKQWPCLEPTAAEVERALLLDVGSALDAIRGEWRRMFRNLELQRHLNEVQVVLNRQWANGEAPKDEVLVNHAVFPVRNGGAVTPSLIKILQAKLPSKVDTAEVDSAIETPSPCLETSIVRDGLRTDHGPPNPVTNGSSPSPTRSKQLDDHDMNISTSSATPELEAMIDQFMTSSSFVKRRYAKGLEVSLAAFRDLPQPQNFSQQTMSNRTQQRTAAESQLGKCHGLLLAVLENSTGTCSAECSHWLRLGGLWPSLTKTALLSQLSTTLTESSISPAIRTLIIDMGVGITRLQRELRLHVHLLRRDFGRLIDELRNEGHENWEPEVYPDWLLLEIESDVMIRKVQVDVAKATVSPESEFNSLLQMNMGQGESKVY